MNKILLLLLLLALVISSNSNASTIKANELPYGAGPAASDSFLYVDLSDSENLKRMLYSEMFSNVGAVTFANGAVLRSGTTAADTLSVSVYENDTATYRPVMLLTSGNDPTLIIAGSANSSVLVDAAAIGSISPVTLGASSLTMTNGGSIRTSTTDANTLVLSGYDVDGAAYKNFVTILNGNVPVFALYPPAGTLGTIDSTNIGSFAPSTGAFTTLSATSTVTFPAGTGSTMTPAGNITKDFTVVGNVGTGEDDLQSYTIPANTLSSGKCVNFKFAGTTANNANAKTINLYAGGGLINTLGLAANQVSGWEGVLNLCGTGTNTQRYFTRITRNNGTSGVYQGTGALDTTASIIVKMTGTATADDDITQTATIVNFD